jgi:hypothetical protein
MYCPLCKAEYRGGFKRCSDCLIALVQTGEQAKAAKVVTLWEGTRQRRFQDIVGALRDANIPHHAKSGAKAERPRTSWDFVPIIRDFKRLNDARENMSWQIFVLESDYASARAVVQNLV